MIWECAFSRVLFFFHLTVSLHPGICIYLSWVFYVTEFWSRKGHNPHPLNIVNIYIHNVVCLRTYTLSVIHFITWVALNSVNTFVYLLMLYTLTSIFKLASAHQASLSFTQSSLKLMSIEWCHPAISSSVVPFSSCPQSLPASGSFPMSQLFTSGGQTIGASVSASVFLMNVQDWSPLEWTGWISLQSKGLSRVFSNTTVQKHQFFSTQLSLQSNSHIHTWLLEKP